MEPPTDKARLAEDRLRQRAPEWASLHAFIADARRRGLSWRKVAALVLQVTGVDTTDVTVSSWFREVDETNGDRVAS